MVLYWPTNQPLKIEQTEAEVVWTISYTALLYQIKSEWNKCRNWPLLQYRDC